MNIDGLKEKGMAVWKKHKIGITLGVIVLGSYGLGHKKGQIVGRNNANDGLMNMIVVRPEILEEMTEATKEILGRR